jgi:hypothetical protein
MIAGYGVPAIRGLERRCGTIPDSDRRETWPRQSAYDLLKLSSNFVRIPIHSRVSMPSMNGLSWVIVASVVMFVLSIVGIGWALVRLPPDYFARTLAERQEYRREHWVPFIARNIVGVLILVAGIVMLFMPGQGLLAILVGVMLVDFPGKRAVIKKIIERRGVLSAANSLRAQFGRPAFEQHE